MSLISSCKLCSTNIVFGTLEISNCGCKRLIFGVGKAQDLNPTETLLAVSRRADLGLATRHTLQNKALTSKLVIFGVGKAQELSPTETLLTVSRKEGLILATRHTPKRTSLQFSLQICAI